LEDDVREANAVPSSRFSLSFSISFLARRACLALIATGCLFAFSQCAVAQTKTPNRTLSDKALAASYGKLPLSFEANQGQSDPQVRFLSRGNGYSLFLTDSSAVLALRKPNRVPAKPAPVGRIGHAPSSETDAIGMELVGANHARVIGADQLPGTANYFIGNNPAKWQSGVPTYGKVRYSGVYPGVDLVYYGNQRQLEYDFVVAPNADTKSIRLHFAGARRLELDSSGNLRIAARNGQIEFHKPVVYQEIDGRRQPVKGHFTLVAKNSVGFRLGSYDRNHAVVIDPTLAYSTYLGGSGGGGYGTAITVDAAGDAYVVGVTYSTDFPVTSAAFQPANKSGASNVFDAFVTKLNPTGASLIYSTYLGGSGNISLAGDFNHGDYPDAISIDSTGNAYVAGIAYSIDFPVTGGAFQTTNKGGPNGVANGFVTKLNASGTALVYSTYLGGSGLTGYAGNATVGDPTGGDGCSRIFVDDSGNAYLTGGAYSIDFPVTSGAFQATNKSAANGLANAFVTKLNASGSALIYSTYLGGSKGDGGTGIAVDSTGNAYVAGATFSTDFSVTSGAFQTENHGAANGFSNGFVAELNTAGSALIYSTYLGGSGNINGPAKNGDIIESLALDSTDNTYVYGTTLSNDFPVTSGAFQSSNKGFVLNLPTLFVSKLNPSGSALVYSSYLGSSGGDTDPGFDGMALDSSGNVYVTGWTLGTDFPVTADAFQSINHCVAPSGSNPSVAGGSNAFVAELNSSGSNLVYSTYLGGSGYPISIAINGVTTTGSFCDDIGYGIAVDTTGNTYLTGNATSSDFPITTGAYQTSKAVVNAAFITKFGLGSSTTGGTITTLTASANPQSAGVAVTFTAFVQSTSGTGAPTGTVSFSVDGGAGASVALNGTGHASYATSTLAAGTHTIKASYSGDTTYSASSGMLTETIIGAGASISVVSGSGQTTPYGSAFADPLVVLVKDASGNPVSGMVVNFAGTGVKLSSSNSTTGANGEAPVRASAAAAGSLTVTASAGGVTGTASFTLTATQPVLTVTANNATRLYGAANPAFIYTVTGFVNGDTSAVIGGTATETTTATSTSPAATYPISFSTESLTATNYTFRYVNGTLTVTGGVAQTITFGALPNVTYGVSPITLGATASSGLRVSYTVTGPATVTGSILTVTGAGIVTVTASQAGNGDFASATSVSQSFIAGKATLTVTANSASIIYGQALPTFSYTITGFVKGDTSALVTGTATETTTANATSPPGTYPITFSAESLTATNYTFAYVSGKLTISGGAAQTITFGVLPNVTYGVSPIALNATSSSGLAVSYVSLTPTVCTVSGSLVTIVTTGTCTIQATQAGNNEYAAATPVSESFTVLPAVSSFTIKPIPAAETVRPGLIGRFLLKLISVGVFDGNVTLSCSGGPTGSNCTDFPHTVKLNGTVYAESRIFLPRDTRPDTYTITFTGVSGSLTTTATAKLKVKRRHGFR
jgi:hypothetical protein